MAPLPPDENRGPTMLGVFWAMAAVSTTMVGLRLFARYKVWGTGYDDWMILVAQVRSVDHHEQVFIRQSHKYRHDN